MDSAQLSFIECPFSKAFDLLPYKLMYDILGV